MSEATVDSAGASAPRARIAWLHVSNYRSIGDDVRIDFGDLTALVGPNGSGKSNVLDVLRFLREALTLGLEPAVTKRLGIARLRREAPTRPRSVRVAVGIATDVEYWYDIRIDASSGGTYKVSSESLSSVDGVADDLLLVEDGNVRTVVDGLAPVGSVTDLVLPSIGSHPRVKPVLDVLRGVRIHSIFPRDLSAPQTVGARPPLDDTGSNWCVALQSLPVDARRNLNLALARITGDIVDTRVDTSGGYYVAEFAHEIDGRRRWFNAVQESDGTLRLAGVLTALLQDPPPSFVGIEEPELTINPGLLPLVHDYLAEASDRTQVAFTTHSPELLDLIDIDNVRVVQRVEGATQVNRVSETQRGIVRDALATPGELLRSGGFDVEGQQLSLLELAGTD